MTNLTPQRALVYARRSQKQDNGASVTEQVRLGREACDELGWDLAEVIDQDFDRSASRFAKKDRPGWERLLSSLRAGLANAVILWESSRGDRKLADWAAFLDLGRDQGVFVHVISQERTYDLRKPADRKALASDGVDSEYEAEKTSLRVRRGILAASKRGEPRGHPPYGYRAVYDDETGKRTGWRIVPEEAAVIREIFDRVSHHHTLQAIMRSLNERGVPSPENKAWTWQHIRYIAMNCAYAALVRLPDETLVPGVWPAIVTRGEWGAAMAVFGPRKAGPRPGSQKHLLTVLAECKCGSEVVVRKVSGKLRYSCRDGCFFFPYEWLDEFVSDVICARLSRPDARDLFRSDDSRSEALQNELAELRQRHAGFCLSAARGQISAEALGAVEAELLPGIQRRQRELDALSVPPVLAEILSARNIRRAWDGYTVQARRAIIRALTGVIIQPVEGRRTRRADLTEERVKFTWEPVRRPGRGQRKNTDIF